MADDIKYEKDPKLFNYSENENRDLGYHTPRYSTTDKSMIALYEILNAMDWAQTQQVSRDGGTHTPQAGGNSYYETNFPTGSAELIGKHPSRDKVNALMGTQALAVPALMHNVPDPYRKLLMTLLILGKAAAVKNNESIGLDAVRW